MKLHSCPLTCSRQIAYLTFYHIKYFLIEESFSRSKSNPQTEFYARWNKQSNRCSGGISDCGATFLICSYWLHQLAEYFSFTHAHLFSLFSLSQMIKVECRNGPLQVWFCSRFLPFKRKTFFILPACRCLLKGNSFFLMWSTPGDCFNFKYTKLNVTDLKGRRLKTVTLSFS